MPWVKKKDSHLLWWICIACVALYHTTAVEIPTQPTLQPENANIPEPYVGCRILINEMDINSEDGTQFLELSKYCRVAPKQNKAVDLSKFKLLVIDSEGNILIICQLKGSLVNRPKSRQNNKSRYYFYVIATEKNEFVDMTFNECQVDKGLNNRIPTGNQYPFAAALLWNEKLSGLSSLNLIQDNLKRWNSISINLFTREVIRKNLQDFLILGSTTPFNTCDVFQEIYSKYTSRPKVILRDWVSRFEVPKSISRCGTSTDPFQPEEMKISPPTPGIKNDCDNGEEFFIEEFMDILPTPRVKSLGIGNRCYAITSPENINNEPINVEQLDKYIEDYNTQEKNQCFSVLTDKDSTDLLQFDEDVDMEDDDTTYNQDNTVADEEMDEDDALDNNTGDDNDLLNNIPTNNGLINTQYRPDKNNVNGYKIFIPELANRNTKYIAGACPELNENWRGQLTREVDMSLITQSSVCEWFVYFPGEKSTATCKYCHALYNAGVLVEADKSKFASKFIKTGAWHSISSSRRTQNAKIITDHLENDLHQISLQYFQNIDKGLVDDDFERAMFSRSGKMFSFYEATVNFLLAVYQSVQMGLPFQQFHNYTNLISFMGVNVGWLHLNAKGVRNGLETISSCMHSELLHHLVTAKPKISVILDESGDISGQSNYAILFQTFDGNEHVATYHYMLLPMKRGNTGDIVFDTFLKQLDKDGIVQYIAENTIAVVADGSKVLQNVFFRHMKQLTRRYILVVWCQNHRLELSYKKIFQKKSDLKAVDALVGDLATFFNNQAIKRRRILVDNTQKFKRNGKSVKPFTIHRLHTIRWIDSRKRSFEGVLSHWDIIIKTLDDISKSRDFESDDQNKADELATQLKNPSLLLRLSWMLDISTQLAKYSLVLQEKNQNLIGKQTLRDQVCHNVQSFATQGGTWMNIILNEIKLPEEEEDMVEESTFIQKMCKIESSNCVYKNVQLVRNTETDEKPFCEQIGQLTTDLMKEFKERFPDDSTENLFEVFSPLHFAVCQNEEKFYGETKLNSLNEVYKLFSDDQKDLFFNNWNNLILSLARHPQFQTKSTKSAREFWEFYLSVTEGIAWTDTLRDVIKSVLVISPSSSAAEREFSLVNAAKNKRRYNLDPKTVNDILEIKINGEKDLSKVNIWAYARKFIEKHRRPDDKFRAKPKAKIQEELPSIFANKHTFLWDKNNI